MENYPLITLPASPVWLVAVPAVATVFIIKLFVTLRSLLGF